MGTNLSKLKRESLIEKIKFIKEEILKTCNEENRQIFIDYLNELEKELTRQKYGLVFEEHEENIDVIYQNNIDVLTEIEELSIMNNSEKLNFLLEGDNLSALRVLNKTHKKLIDVIYIDPPYNTGNKDFIYDDDCVDSLDTFRHSKWLSFMKKRLSLASTLLKEDGIIFISIDDNEYAPLKILCDDIFGESNYVSTIVWQKAFAPKNDNKYISTSHEYILLYAKNKSKYKRNLLPRTEESNKGYKNPDNDPRGPWTSGTMLATTFSKSGVFGIQKPNGDIAYPPEGRCWRYSPERVKELIADNRVYFGADGKNVPRVKRFLTEVQQGIVPQSLWLHTEVGNNQNATNELQKILGKQVFSFPKPSSLIKQCIKLHGNSNAIILDFFAGSGTTGDAVMQLNNEDGGNRKFILCTNNENNICREITYERIKRVIERDNYDDSLKYFKIDYIETSEKLYYEYANELLYHIRELVELENGVSFEQCNNLKIILTDEELDSFIEENNSNVIRLYIGHDVLLDESLKIKLHKKGIDIVMIPDYYYAEMRG